MKYPDRKLTLVAGSGGALIATLAAEATDFAGEYILEGEVFHRVVLVSAAMSTERSLKRLDTITADGIYNVYSPIDATLQGEVCFPKASIDYGWPAAGRFGYRSSDSNYRYIKAQLGWRPEFRGR